MVAGQKFFSVVTFAAARTTNFPPGWNGNARTPPMAWRSWNAFGAAISQDLMVDVIDSLSTQKWEVGGKMRSLAEVG